MGGTTKQSYEIASPLDKLGARNDAMTKASNDAGYTSKKMI